MAHFFFPYSPRDLFPTFETTALNPPHASGSNSNLSSSSAFQS